MSLAQQIADALSLVRSEYSEWTIVYSRGDISVTAIKAVKSSTPFRIQDAQGRSFINRSVDWLLATTDLTGSTLADLPLVGDRITATHVDGESLTCVVTEFNGEPCYQYSDEARSQLCVHCQELV